jgi:hypothetical protein
MKNKMTPLAISLLIMSSSQFALAQQCVDLFSKQKAPRLEKIEDSEKLVKLYEHLSMLLESDGFTQALSGLRKPSWNEYNSLIEIKKLIKGSDPVQRIKYLSTDERLLLQARLKGLIDVTKALTEKSIPKAQFKEFLDNHYAWFKLIESINKDAGFELIPNANLSVLRSNEKLTSDAEKIVKDLESNFTETFETSGHKNFEDFKKYTRAFSPEMRRKMDVIENGLIVGMHRPESARFWIPIAGFQNQRITGSSNGAFSPEYRDKAEANLIELPYEKFVPLSSRFKPNYAEARPHMTNTKDNPETSASHYGSDIWVFKEKSIESRSTWSPKDSLRPGLNQGVNTWNNHFIPWKNKALMTPYWAKPSFYPTEINPDFKLETNSPSRWSRYGSSYFEVQIWGPSTIDDIQAFIFKGNPPDKEFYQYLLSKKIEVWDERTWPAKKYNGDESK